MRKECNGHLKEIRKRNILAILETDEGEKANFSKHIDN